MKAAALAALAEPRLDLRSRAVHQHEPHAKRGKQVQVLGEVEEAAVRDDVAAERDDERLAAERVDVRRDRLEPVYEAVLWPQARSRRGALRRLGARLAVALSFSLANDRRLPPAAGPGRSNGATT